MPLIEQPTNIERVNVRVKMSVKMRQNIINYCQWAGFENNINHFICEAVDFILNRDKDWQKHMSNSDTKS